MPLPSILCGAKQCQVLTKRTKQQCKNPAAFGCKSCRLHGAHRSRKVLQGPEHPQFKHGQRSNEHQKKNRLISLKFHILRDIGDYLSMFRGPRSPGRKPKGYRKADIEDFVNYLCKFEGSSDE